MRILQWITDQSRYDNHRVRGFGMSINADRNIANVAHYYY